MNDDRWLGVLLCLLVAFILAMTWFMGDRWREIHINQACNRDGFVYLFDKRFECHATEPKSPQ